MSNASKGMRRVLVLDHRRDGLADLVAQLRRSGYEVAVSSDVDDSVELVDEWEPSLVILNPLVAKAGGTEFDLLERLQREHAVPVIVLLDSRESLEQARHIDAPLRDFVLAPYDVDELLHRVELAMSARQHMLDLHARARDLEGQVTNDFKTGLLSERFFRQMLGIEFKRAHRNKAPLSLLLIDVDNFKTINDTTDYGFGDLVLREVATALKNTCRETDFAARFGGDEFVVLLPQTTPVKAVQTALRIRNRIRELTIRNERHATKITISIGIDCFDGISSSTPEELSRRANKALHEAKARGKNQAWLFAEPPDDDENLQPPRPSRGSS